MMRNKIIFIVGPTAVGKSAVALRLAKRLGSQIISCDSMQIYKGMDIITSKPSKEELKKIKHHLISFVSPSCDYNVSQYRKAALDKIRSLIKKGKIPILVGGTGLYVTCLVDGLFEQPPITDRIRKKLIQQVNTLGNQYLFERLKKIDPVSAARIHPNDTKRIVRALEVFEACGVTISELQRKREGLVNEYDVRIYGLLRDKEELYQRIEKRVEEMFRQGLIREVSNLIKKPLSTTARYAIGVRELKDYFLGKCSLEQAKELIKKNTRRYAKRQLTWFKKDKRIIWMKFGKKETPGKMAAKILKLVKKKSAEKSWKGHF